MSNKKKKRARGLVANGFSYQAAMNQLNAKMARVASETRGKPPSSPRDISDEWKAAFAVLEKVEDADGVQLLAGGTWRQSFACLGSSTRELLLLLPGAYELIVHDERELRDGTGNGIDIELETEVWVCESERAVLSCVDHWQAGLCGSLTVYPTLELFRAAVAEAIQREAEASEEHWTHAPN